jgi:hypothetical protein
LDIVIWNLFLIWCLKFGIFNALVSFSIRLTTFRASGGADSPVQHQKPETYNLQQPMFFLDVFAAVGNRSFICYKNKMLFLKTET